MIRSLVVLLLFCSCTSMPSLQNLFPHGVYHHQVTVERKGRIQSFSGVNKWSVHDLTLVALGVMDVTLIKYRENLENGEQELFVNRNFFSIPEEQLKDYLGFVKEVYSLNRSICKKNHCHKSFYGAFDLYLDLNDSYEVSEIHFEVRNVKVHIKVVGYEKSM